MSEKRMYHKNWDFNPDLSQPYGLWELSYSDQRDIQLLKLIMENLSDIIRPISFNIRILTGKSKKEARRRDVFNYANPNSFSITEIESLYTKSLSQIDVPESNVFTMLDLSWQVHITYNKRQELVTEWYPITQDLSNFLMQYPSWNTLNGLLDTLILNDFMSVSTYSNIWVPHFRDDILASINGERLRKILINLEKFSGGRIEQWMENGYGNNPPGRDRMVERYGFMDPKDLPMDFRKI